MSSITIYNNTDELVRVALYQKPVLSKSLQTIAWQIASPPPGGKAVVSLPADFAVYSNYSLDPNNPDDTQYQTNKVTFGETTARFDVTNVTSQDGRANGALIQQSFADLKMNEVHIINNFGLGVVGHITRDGDDIYPAQVIWPGGRFMEDVRSTLYMAVVGQFTTKGDRLVQEEVSATETPILENQSSTLTGSKWKGYAFSIE